jgi:hypothetical protein
MNHSCFGEALEWCIVLYHLDLYMNPHKPLHLPLFASTLKKQLDLFFECYKPIHEFFFPCELWQVSPMTSNVVHAHKARK